MKQIVKNIRKLNNLTPIASKILFRGQAVVTAFFIAILAYAILNITLPHSAMSLYNAMNLTKLMMESTLTALAIVWGGALFVDYAWKKEKQDSQ